jgi:protein gp37
MGVAAYQQPFTVVRELPQRLNEPLAVKAPTVWFVNSMSDLFQDGVSDAFIGQVFDTIKKANWHQFQILTKRPERMAAYFAEHPAPPANAWLGVSVENVKQGVPRIALLRRVPATVRFLSIEPLLERLGKLDLRGIHWVIVGGESGAGARLMQREWVEEIHRQCVADRKSVV